MSGTAIAGLVPVARAADKSAMRPDPLRPLRLALDYALPPRCAGCGAIGSEDHRFCATCWSGMRLLGEPSCASCRLPFAVDRGEGARCGACSARPPRHAGVYAAVAYGDIAAAVAVRLKHGGRIALAETMARAMARRLPPGAELLVPVPLHRWRLWRRGFNQAALVADAVARLTGVACAPDALMRLRSTRLLRGLGRRARARAVTGAFAVMPARADAVRGRRVVLVDDVYTTGATADGCARALLRAGAVSVEVLCWARVLPGQPD